MAAKESYILGCWWPPRKVVSLAAVKFYWLICNFGASLLYLAAKPPKNNPCRLAAKKIGFPWLSILGGFCLAASRQGSFPWRFWCFPWRFLAAKVIPFWCSGALCPPLLQQGLPPTPMASKTCRWQKRGSEPTECVRASRCVRRRRPVSSSRPRPTTRQPSHPGGLVPGCSIAPPSSA